MSLEQARCHAVQAHRRLIAAALFLVSIVLKQAVPVQTYALQL